MTTCQGPPRPRLTYRIGITGARNLDDRFLQAIRGEIEQVLEQVVGALAGVANEPVNSALYAKDDTGDSRPVLRILSPLAKGSDRLVVETATRMKLDFQLDIALPFDRDEYAKDFDEADRQAFDDYLGPAGTAAEKPYLIIDGGRGDDENRSYEAVGRIVARNCDLLIAVWDGRPARGLGGTADTVRFAARFGPPVWWIDAEGRLPPRLIASSGDLRWRGTAPQGEAARAKLAAAIDTALRPPKFHGHGGHGVIGRAVHLLGVSSPTHADPLKAYLEERPLPRRMVWQAHRWFFRVIAGPTRSGASGSSQDAEASFWSRQYEPADRASLDYRDRYRSSYVLVFGIATLAVVCAIFALAYPRAKPVATALELVCLAFIIALVYLNQKHDWHGRWIAYRLLAELCRKQEALSLLGWSLPPSDLRRFEADAAPVPWAGWYFNALLRSAPLARGNLNGETLERIRARVRAKLIAGQASYHGERKRISALVGPRLSRLGEIFFLATVAIVAFKLMLIPLHEAHDVVTALGVAAAILPALSAAFVGIRAYAEMELLEHQSARIEKIMAAADIRIRSLRLGYPLASQDLAADVFDLSAEMLQDVAGWAALFHLKVVEAG